MRCLLLIPVVAGLFAVACSKDEDHASSPAVADADAAAAEQWPIEPEQTEVIDPSACQTANPPIGRASSPMSAVASCTDDQSGALAVDLTVSAASVAQGQPLTITWTATGVTEALSIGFYVEGGDTDTPLLIEAIDLCGKTSGTTTWDGKSRACVPEDAAAFCSWRPQPGEYRAHAVVFDGKKAKLVLGYSGIDPRPTPRRTESRSAPFQITGSYDANPLKKSMLEEAEKGASESLGPEMYGAPVDRYVKMRCESFAAAPDGKYCATFDLQPPLTGTFQTCGSDVITRTGTASYAPGILTYTEAETKARAAVEAEGTPDIRKWVYRTEDAGYWAFEVYMQTTSGQYTNVVRVGNDGAACISKKVPMDLPNSLDIWTDKVACP